MSTPSFRVTAMSALDRRSGALTSVPALSLSEASKARIAEVSIAGEAGAARRRAERRRAGAGAGAAPPSLSRSSSVVLRSAVMLGRAATLASTVPSMVWPLAVTLPL